MAFSAYYIIQCLLKLAENNLNKSNKYMNLCLTIKQKQYHRNLHELPFSKSRNEPTVRTFSNNQNQARHNYCARNLFYSGTWEQSLIKAAVLFWHFREARWAWDDVTPPPRPASWGSSTRASEVATLLRQGLLLRASRRGSWLLLGGPDSSSCQSIGAHQNTNVRVNRGIYYCCYCILRNIKTFV